MRQVLGLGMLGMLMLIGAGAEGIRPTEEELIFATNWRHTHLASGSTLEVLPFSFVYGGDPASKWAKPGTMTGWKTEEHLDLKDPVSGLDMDCAVTLFPHFPAVEWCLTFTNKTDRESPILEEVYPLDLRLEAPPNAEWTLHYARGDSNSAESFAPVERSLGADLAAPLVFAPNGGRSSDGFLPFFNLKTEGRGVLFAIGWTGQWEARFEREKPGVIRVCAGMQTTRLKLLPGESVRTPRILVCFYDGDDPLRGTNLLRQLLLAHVLPRRNGNPVFPPICASVNETAPDGSYEEPHIRVMQPLGQRGIEVFWSDMDPQQWYPGGFPDGTGTWEPDPAKYPHGLKPIGEAARAAGLEYFLWFEPERVAPGSRIAREHPEWVTGAEKGGLFKLHIPEARAWLTDYIDAQISAAGLGWIRWDFNIEPLKYWLQNDAPDRQGATEMHHVAGLYAMWDELQKRHPGLLVDICASGGRRIDIETIRRGLPLWHSDLQCSGPHPAADQLQNAGLFRWLPMHGSAAFAYEPSYVFRSEMTGGNIFTAGNAKGFLNAADADTEGAVKRTVALYKKIRPYTLGDFYPLFPFTASEDAWFGYHFHRDDLNAGCAIVFRREKSPQSTASIRLRGVGFATTYDVTFEDAGETRVFEGRALEALPVEIPTAPGAAIVWYSKHQ